MKTIKITLIGCDTKQEYDCFVLSTILETYPDAELLKPLSNEINFLKPFLHNIHGPAIQAKNKDPMFLLLRYAINGKILNQSDWEKERHHYLFLEKLERELG